MSFWTVATVFSWHWAGVQVPLDRLVRACTNGVFQS